MTDLPVPAALSAAEAALFLDLDGTLIALTDDPNSVTMPESVRQLLQHVASRVDGALALVSGRRIDALDKIVAPLKLPLSGLHGLERRSLEGVYDISRPPGAAGIDALRNAVLALEGTDPRFLVEDKGLTLAIHYRRITNKPYARELIGQAIGALPPNVIQQSGQDLIELRPEGLTKGSAIEAFMLEPAFRHRVPVFIGDDTTDEFGFGAVNQLGGVSIKVGPGPTSAKARLDNPAAVLAWLANCAAL